MDHLTNGAVRTVHPPNGRRTPNARRAREAGRTPRRAPPARRQRNEADLGKSLQKLGIMLESPSSRPRGEHVPHVEIDLATDQYLGFAAKIAGVSKGEVVARLVEMARSTVPDPSVAAKPASPDHVPIYADYGGHRTYGMFIPGPGRIDITEGPLAGKSYGTPSQAARAVVELHNPSVNSNRNGWVFWLLSDNGSPLQSIRYVDRWPGLRA